VCQLLRKVRQQTMSLFRKSVNDSPWSLLLSVIPRHVSCRFVTENVPSTYAYN